MWSAIARLRALQEQLRQGAIHLVAANFGAVLDTIEKRHADSREGFRIIWEACDSMERDLRSAHAGLAATYRDLEEAERYARDLERTVAEFAPAAHVHLIRTGQVGEVVCARCRGTKLMWRLDPKTDQAESEPCAVCNGTGKPPTPEELQDPLWWARNAHLLR